MFALRGEAATLSSMSARLRVRAAVRLTRECLGQGPTASRSWPTISSRPTKALRHDSVIRCTAGRIRRHATRAVDIGWLTPSVMVRSAARLRPSTAPPSELRGVGLVGCLRKARPDRCSSKGASLEGFRYLDRPIADRLHLCRFRDLCIAPATTTAVTAHRYPQSAQRYQRRSLRVLDIEFAAGSKEAQRFAAASGPIGENGRVWPSPGLTVLPMPTTGGRRSDPRETGIERVGRRRFIIQSRRRGAGLTNATEPAESVRLIRWLSLGSSDRNSTP